MVLATAQPGTTARDMDLTRTQDSLVKLANDMLTAVRQRVVRDRKGRRGRGVNPQGCCKVAAPPPELGV